MIYLCSKQIRLNSVKHGIIITMCSNLSYDCDVIAITKILMIVFQILENDQQINFGSEDLDRDRLTLGSSRPSTRQTRSSCC